LSEIEYSAAELSTI